MKALTNAEIVMLKASGYIEGNPFTIPHPLVFGDEMHERVKAHEAGLSVSKLPDSLIPAKPVLNRPGKRQPKGKAKHG